MNFKILLLLCQFLFTCTLSFHVQGQRSHSATVHRQSLHLSTKLTTVLVFAAPICEGCVDRGHPDIATSTVTGMRNVLRVKARSAEMPMSNLTVFTTDGRIYSFEVFYQDQPHQTLISFEENQPPPVVQFTDAGMNEAEIEDYAKIVKAAKSEFNRPRQKTTGNMQIRLANLYQKNGLFFLKFDIRNGSAIDYDMSFCRFYIRDRKVGKRTAVMEKPVQPVYMLQPPGDRVPKFAYSSLVAAIEKFTIADNKYFMIEIFEENGDRPLTLKIKGKHLLRARSE